MTRLLSPPRSTTAAANMTDLTEGDRIRFTYHAGTDPGCSRTATFRNYSDGLNGRLMYADDGTMNGECKRFLTRYVADLTVIDEEAGVSFSQSVEAQLARLDRLRAELDAFLSRLDTLKRALGETDEGGRRVRRRL